MSEKSTFTELLGKLQEIPICESRIDHPESREFVINAEQIIPLHLILQDFFGENFKAPGIMPTLEDKKRAALLGGVRQYQTLYFTENEGFHNCAMLWPWEDGVRCTVKIARWQ